MLCKSGVIDADPANFQLPQGRACPGADVALYESHKQATVVPSAFAAKLLYLQGDLDDGGNSASALRSITLGGGLHPEERQASDLQWRAAARLLPSRRRVDKNIVFRERARAGHMLQIQEGTQRTTFREAHVQPWGVGLECHGDRDLRHVEHHVGKRTHHLSVRACGRRYHLGHGRKKRIGCDRIGDIVVNVAMQNFGRINDLAGSERQDVRRRAVKFERLIRQPSRVARIGVAARLPPNFPQSIDICVMKPEDRIERGSPRVSHDAANIVVDLVMRDIFKAPVDAPAVAESRPWSAKPGMRANRAAGELIVGQAV